MDGAIIKYDTKDCNAMNHRLKNAVVCRSLLSQVRGLMFSPKKTLVFAFKEDEHVPLHMWFVFFPIDVLYLNKDRKVIEVKKNFSPFAMYSPKVKARYVVEIPKRTSIKVGDTLLWGRRDLNPD